MYLDLSFEDVVARIKSGNNIDSVQVQLSCSVSNTWESLDFCASMLDRFVNGKFREVVTVKRGDVWKRLVGESVVVVLNVNDNYVEYIAYDAGLKMFDDAVHVEDLKEFLAPTPLYNSVPWQKGVDNSSKV